MDSPNQTAQQLMQLFLKGQGAVTQTPGPASANTRQFYSYHPGYDIGVNQGTPIYAPASGQVKNLGVQGGYGQRVSYYDPQTNKTYLLSHLSKVQSTGNVKPGSIIGYSGGAKGTYGAGNTTGPHVDIEIYSGQGNFAQQLGKITNQMNQGTASTYRKKINVGNIIAKAREQYGNKIGAVGSKKYIQDLVNKGKGKMVKINI